MDSPWGEGGGGGESGGATVGIELEGLVGILLFGFWIWAILDVIATEAELCRNLPKGVWLILVLILPDIGSLVWVLLGRPERGRTTQGVRSVHGVGHSPQPP